MNQPFLLAIDTSCDDTAAAVISGQYVVSNVIASQTQLHKQYGGVFPTVAKQAHQENIEATVRAALHRGQVTWSDLTGIAVTQGPGLAPALEVGLRFAEKMGTEHQLPVFPINHIEGHLVSSLAKPVPRGADISSLKTQLPTQWPTLAVIVSGGHTEFIQVDGVGQYQRLGWTVDDAAGEALDKFGRMIDLGYPAGPVVEQFARRGDPKKYVFPLPMTTSGDYNLSFSGLKTAVRHLTEELTKEKTLSKQDIYDLCASFQFAVFRAITYKLNKILMNQNFSEVWLGGGVAANLELRRMIRATLRDRARAQHVQPVPFKTPYTKRLCMDNAAMIGVVAGLRLSSGISFLPHPNLDRRPRWEVGEV